MNKKWITHILDGYSSKICISDVERMVLLIKYVIKYFCVFNKLKKNYQQGKEI